MKITMMMKAFITPGMALSSAMTTCGGGGGGSGGGGGGGGMAGDAGRRRGKGRCKGAPGVMTGRTHLVERLDALEEAEDAKGTEHLEI